MTIVSLKRLDPGHIMCMRYNGCGAPPLSGSSPAGRDVVEQLAPPFAGVDEGVFVWVSTISEARSG
jgi:hypothetical protein